MTTIELFTTPDCPRCPKAVEVLESLENDFNFRLEITDAIDNRPRALKYGVVSVPTIVINGEETITGVPSRDEVVTHLDR